jgi:hypothetical protein
MVRDDLLTTPRVSRREFRWKPDAQRQITGTRCSFKHEKWRKNLGVTKEHLSYEMGFWNVEGLSAYAVISGLSLSRLGLGPHVVACYGLGFASNLILPARKVSVGTDCDG